MSDWKTSRAALRLHSAAYDIEAAWEDSRPVTRAMCEQYHAAVDDALVADMPEDCRSAEAARLRGWVKSGVIPAAGAKWAEYVATMLETQKKPRGRPAGQTYSATIPPQRVTPEQRATWDALGADWLRQQLDREAKRLARQRDSDPPPPTAD